MTWQFLAPLQRILDYSNVLRQSSVAFASPASSGATQLVAAQTGLRIVVLQIAVIASAAQNVRFQSAGTDISCTFPLAANGGFVLPASQLGWFQTNVGEALNVNLSAAALTGITLTWCAAP